jgi:hypothetical protein
VFVRVLRVLVRLVTVRACCTATAGVNAWNVTAKVASFLWQ